METFIIPCQWSEAGKMRIEAETLEEALTIAEEEYLPDGDYLNDSFIIFKDEITIEEES